MASRPCTARTASSSTGSRVLEAVEEPATRAEQDGHDVHLDLVELAGPDEGAGGPGTVDHHVLASGALSGRGGALAHVGVEAGGPWWHVVLGDVVGEHEDRDAVMMVAVPATGELERAAAGDDRAGGHALRVHLAVGAWAVAVVEPVEEPEATAAHLLPGPIVRTGDEPVEGHGHVEADGGH